MRYHNSAHLQQRSKARTFQAARSVQRSAGFTLIEAIIVIVLTAIVVGMVSMFIRLPFISYVDTAARAELADAADTALRRISRDLRLALPNSVRVSPTGDSIELLLTKTGGRYLDSDDGLAGNILQFEKPGLNCLATPSDVACVFDVIGTMPTAPRNILAGDKIVVYNLGFDIVDAYSGGNIATVRTVVGNSIYLNTQPFALQSPAMPSPTKRFQVVTTPVTYSCEGANTAGGGRLMRYDSYPITAVQQTPPTGAGVQSALLADGVVECNFSYSDIANIHSGLLTLTVKMKRPGTESGTVQLISQVHVDNTP